MRNTKFELVLALLFPAIVCPGASAQAPTPADAMALERQGELPEAARAWRAVIQRDPTDAAAFASLGIVLSRQEKYPEAASAYRTALKLNPKLPGVELNLGLAEFKQGHFSAAAPALHSALAADPSNSQARTLLGLSYYGNRKFDLAVAISRTGCQGRSRQCRTESGRWRKAACGPENFLARKRSFAESRNRIRTLPRPTFLLVKLSTVWERLQRPLPSSKPPQKYLLSEPNVHFGLGYLHWKSQQYDDARQEFERELALDPNHAQALAYLGDIDWKNNHPDEALALLKRSVAVKKDLRIVYVDLGAIYMQQKDYKDAQAALLRAVELDPTVPDAHYQLGRLYQAIGDSSNAEKELHKVQELHKKAEDNLVGKISSSPPALNPSEAR